MSSSPAITERDWLRSADAIPLLDHLFPMHGFHSIPDQPRKLRLYYAACARRAFRNLNPMQRGLLEAAERLADGAISSREHAEIARLGESFDGGPDELRQLGELLGCDPQTWSGGRSTNTGRRRERLGWLVFQGLRHVVPAPAWVHRSLHSADVVRDLFPNPFRITPWQAGWRSDAAVRIARCMYEARVFGGMGQLADALEEAGCRDEDILLHCRDEYAVHYRGCWVVDWFLEPAGPHLGLQ